MTYSKFDDYFFKSLTIFKLLTINRMFVNLPIPKTNKEMKQAERDLPCVRCNRTRWVYRRRCGPECTWHPACHTGNIINCHTPCQHSNIYCTADDRWHANPDRQTDRQTTENDWVELTRHMTHNSSLFSFRDESFHPITALQYFESNLGDKQLCWTVFFYEWVDECSDW